MLKILSKCLRKNGRRFFQRKLLKSPGMQFKAGTEPPFSGAYDKFFEKGRYVCVCCGAELFNSDSKYWAGCGWPAFSKSVDNDMNIVRIEDNSLGMKRTEVRCKKCNAHLGHVFDDGPKETGERYCINSVCMAFEKAD
ncbi:methionine-R-sulfoxide reductase [Ancylostoma duodenale]|uniref:Peptide-methionine (R)-S-oxide reductase n=1 Tax=Ancylostoma duodenale TaxID=51022 RepID=A0A0C2H0N1_9BILA|nr:methionine-R-sulfoxide reductase [Ancylostoma duodenale]